MNHEKIANSILTFCLVGLAIIGVAAALFKSEASDARALSTARMKQVDSGIFKMRGRTTYFVVFRDGKTGREYLCVTEASAIVELQNEPLRLEAK